jgi:hypothetical protein
MKERLNEDFQALSGQNIDLVLPPEHRSRTPRIADELEVFGVVDVGALRRVASLRR